MYRGRSFEEHYNHFSDRLKERYNLEITEEEYIDLVVKENYYKLSSNATFCSTCFKGVEIVAVYDRVAKRFRTCLPYDINILPIPNTFIEKYIRRTYFNEFVNNKIKEVRELNELWLLDKKTLFMTHPKPIAHLVYAMKKAENFGFDLYKTKVYLIQVISTLYEYEILEYNSKRQEEETL